MIIEDSKTLELASEFLDASSVQSISGAIAKGSTIVVRRSVLATESGMIVDIGSPTGDALSTSEENAMLDLCEVIEDNLESLLRKQVVH